MRPSRPSTSIARRAGCPVVLMNMSMTADGKIATHDRRVSTFGSRLDHDHLLDLRATVDAVMCGARTADLNDINLGPGGVRHQCLRERNGLSRFNLRIVVSGSGTLNPEATLFRHTFSPVIVLTTERAPLRNLQRLRRVAEVRVCGRREIDWPSTLRMLARAHGVRRLLCEGGGALNAGLFHAGLVDELHLTICPFIAGGQTAPTIADGSMRVELSRCTRMQRVRWEQRGGELFAVFRKSPSRALQGEIKRA